MRTASIGACLAVLLCGCLGGGDGGGSGDGAVPDVPGPGGGACMQIAGSWTVAQHCDASFVGTASTVTQSGCDYIASSGGFECPGAIDADGSVEHSCTGGGSQDITCVGNASATRIDLDCGDCIVALRR